MATVILDQGDQTSWITEERVLDKEHCAEHRCNSCSSMIMSSAVTTSSPETNKIIKICPQEGKMKITFSKVYSIQSRKEFTS